MIEDTRFRDTLNFRQLGGYMTAEGRTVKENVFYRSGAPCLLYTSPPMVAS